MAVVEEWWLVVEAMLKPEMSSRWVEEEDREGEEYVVEEERENNMFDMLM